MTSTSPEGTDPLPSNLDKAVFERLGSLLQAFYAELPREPVPPRIVDLLDRLHGRAPQSD